MPHAIITPRTRTNAKEMRRVMTDADLKLWNELRAHRLMGLGFRRQRDIDGVCGPIVAVAGLDHPEPAVS